MARRRDLNKINKNPFGKGGYAYDQPPPRLVTLRQKRHEKKIDDVLAGEDIKKEKAKVSLPKLKFMENATKEREK